MGKLVLPMRRPPLFAAIACCVATYAVTARLELPVDARAGTPTEGVAVQSGLRLQLGFIGEASAGGEIRVGDELMAIDDVSLDEARICKGSKVSVSGRAVRSGKVFLDVALADGHVVRAVPMAEIRRSFRVVNA